MLYPSWNLEGSPNRTSRSTSEVANRLQTIDSSFSFTPHSEIDATVPVTKRRKRNGRALLDRSVDVEENRRTSGEDIVRSSSADCFLWKDRIGNEIVSERRTWTIRVNNNRHSIGQRKSFWSIEWRPREMTHRHGLAQCRLSPSPYLSNLFAPIFIRRNSIVRLLTEDVFHASR